MKKLNSFLILFCIFCQLLSAQTTSTLDFTYTGPNNCHPFKTDYSKFSSQWYSKHGSASHIQIGQTHYARLETSSGDSDGIISSEQSFNSTDIITVQVKATNSYFYYSIGQVIPYSPEPYFNIYLTNQHFPDTIYSDPSNPTPTCNGDSPLLLPNDYKLTHLPDFYTAYSPPLDQYIDYNFQAFKRSNALFQPKIFLYSNSSPKVSHVEYVKVTKTPLDFHFFDTFQYPFPPSLPYRDHGSFEIMVNDVEAAHPNVDNLIVQSYTFDVVGGAFTKRGVLGLLQRKIRVYPDCGTHNVIIKCTVLFTDGSSKQIQRIIPRQPISTPTALQSFPSTEYCLASGNQLMNLTVPGYTFSEIVDKGLSVRWIISGTGIQLIAQTNLPGETLPPLNADLYNTGFKQSFQISSAGIYSIKAEIIPNCFGTGTPAVLASTPELIVKVSDGTPIIPVPSPLILCGYNTPSCFNYNPRISITVSNSDNKLLVYNTNNQICAGNIWWTTRTSPIQLTATNACGTTVNNVDVMINYPQYCPNQFIESENNRRGKSFRIIDQSPFETITIKEIIKSENLETTKSVEVFDLNGRRLYQREFLDFIHKIPTGDFPKGMLIIRIKLNQEITTLKHINY